MKTLLSICNTVHLEMMLSERTLLDQLRNVTVLTAEVSSLHRLFWKIKVSGCFVNTRSDNEHVCVAFLSTLASVPAWLQERTVNCLTDCLSKCLSDAASDQHPHRVDTIAACLDGFSLGARVLICH